MVVIPRDAAVPRRNLADRCGCSVRRCQDWAGDGGAPREAGLRIKSEVCALLYKINGTSLCYDFSRGPVPRGGRRGPDPR